jgi:hypothetical protein
MYDNEEDWKKAILGLGYDENVYAAALALFKANKKINK